jgi:SAM-dependent methyltransferase
VSTTLRGVPGLGFLDRVTGVTGVTVDADGVRARSRQEAVLDVFFDDRRILSFWLHRDGVKDGSGWLFAWPKTLREFLDGSTDVRVVVTRTGEEVFRREVAFGSGRGRVEVVNQNGQPISLDKYLRRVVAFDTRSREELEPMLDAIAEVIAALREIGIEAFLVYGTLLGAFREGTVIGNDSDADLGYVSHLSHPVDVIRESFRIQRALVAHGYRITRYSALAFKVDIEEADGTIRGLDVFGGFLMDGNLHLMGEIREPFEESWIYPLGTTTLEGRTFPAPADPDKMLRAAYGASWRVPDPAFHFEPPATTVRRLNGWFRGLRVGRARWDRIYSRVLKGMPGPSPFIQWVASIEGALGTYVDIGCGRGADALYMSERGEPSLGLDFQPRSFAEAEQGSADNHLVTYWTMNLLEIRQVLAVGAIVARRPGRTVLTARHLVDATKKPARDRLWRMCRMMLSGEAGGRLYVEFLSKAGSDGYAGRHRVRRRKPAKIVAELERWGATVVHRETLPVSDGPGASKVCRLIVEWRREDG